MVIELKVKDVMSKRVITIEADANIQEVGRKMAKARVGSVIVTKNKRPVGIITDSDLIKKVVSKNILHSKVKVEDIMSSTIIIKTR